MPISVCLCVSMVEQKSRDPRCIHLKSSTSRTLAHRRPTLTWQLTNNTNSDLTKAPDQLSVMNELNKFSQ